MNDLDTPATSRNTAGLDAPTGEAIDTPVDADGVSSTTDAAHDSLAAIEQSLENPDHARAPILNVEKYIEGQEKRERRSRLLLQIGLPIAVLVLVIAGLKMSGRLSTSGVTALVREKQMAAAAQASPPPALSGPSTVPSVSSSPTSSVIPEEVAIASLMNGGTVEVAHTKPSQRVASDLTTYIYRDMRAISGHDQIALAAFAEAWNQKPQKKEVILQQLQGKVIPEYQLFVAAASKVHPATPEVRGLHNILVKSAHLRLQAFQHLAEGQRDQTEIWKYGVNGLFQTADAYERLFQQSVSTLAGDQGVRMP